MKRLLLITVMLGVAICYAKAQSDIYMMNARGEVIADSAFIDPFVWINPTVEYEPLYSRTLFTPGLSGSYTVKLYRYKNSENDGGYFSIVEIDCGSKQVLRMIQTDGWDKFDPDYSPTSDYYKLVRLDDSTYALLFVGFNYASEPGLLTIVILRGGQATLVYNKGRHITSLAENPLKIHTISQFLEAVPESTHASLYEVIYQDGNLLKWRKGKN